MVCIVTYTLFLSFPHILDTNRKTIIFLLTNLKTILSQRDMECGHYSQGLFDAVIGLIVSVRHDATDFLTDAFRYDADDGEDIEDARFLRTDFDPMCKKLTLIQILVANGVPQLPQLYHEYKASLADHIQKRHEVCWWIIEFRLRIVDLVQFASRTNEWAREIYNHCYDEYSNLYRHLAERCGACPR